MHVKVTSKCFIITFSELSVPSYCFINKKLRAFDVIFNYYRSYCFLKHKLLISPNGQTYRLQSTPYWVDKVFLSAVHP